MKNTCGFVNGRQSSQIYNKNYLKLKKLLVFCSFQIYSNSSCTKKCSCTKRSSLCMFFPKSKISFLKEFCSSKQSKLTSISDINSKRQNGTITKAYLKKWLLLTSQKYVFIKLILQCHAYLFQVQIKDIFLAPSKMCFMLDLLSLKQENISLNISCQLSNSLFLQISPSWT